MHTGQRVLAHTLSSAVVIFMALASVAFAHELRPAVADISIEESEVNVSIELSLEPLVAGLDLASIFDTNESPKANLHDELRALSAQDLEAKFKEKWPEISRSIQLLAGETALDMILVSVMSAEIGDVEIPRDSKIEFKAALPADGSPVSFGWDAANGALVVRQVSATPETAYEAYLTGGELTTPIPRSGAAQVSWIVTFTDFVVIGFEHIIPKGLDHILFVLGLFFFSLKMRPLLWQISAFTLAHTVTLALATLGLVNISGSIVEPLIAASIVYVAIENIFARGYSQWRTVIVFGFGLLHGLGFASVLGDVGLNPGRFVTSLIGFNIGVEIGQLAVIAVAFILIGSWAGKRESYQRLIATPASVAIAGVGAFWFVERVFF